jgi:hypothetical protein
MILKKTTKAKRNKNDDNNNNNNNNKKKDNNTKSLVTLYMYHGRHKPSSMLGEEKFTPCAFKTNEFLKTSSIS